MPFNGEDLGDKYLCMKQFERHERDEMHAEIGDVLTLCETDEPGWMIGRNETNLTVGIIEKSHIEPLIVVVKDLAELPYFYDTVTTDLIQYNPIGTFLLRRSSKGADTYALLVKTQFGLVEKFLIVGSPSIGFKLAGRPFPTIGHVLARYCDRAISGGVRLTRAVCLKHQKKTSCSFSRRSTAEVRWPATLMAQMSSSQYDDVRNKEKCEKEIDRIHDEEFNEHIETNSTAVASTIALRKSREEKQWKECWLTLSDTSSGPSQLAVFDSMGSKLRQRIDLSACILFWIDESVFAADGCLFLSPSFPTQPPLFLCFRPFTTFLKWVRMLRSRTIFQEPATSPVNMSIGEMSSQISLLSVEIDKFRSEALKTDMMYSANVLLNGVKVGSSNCFAPTGNRSTNELPVVVIDSKFVIPCIPTCSTNIQLSVIGHSSAGKKGRPCGISVSICLNENNETVSQNPTDAGFVFRANRTSCPILAVERYQPLLEAIRESPSSLLGWPSQVLPQHLKVFMYSCISNLYALNPCFMSPVIRKIIGDVLATSSPEDVFRKDSLATGIMTQCLRHLFKTPFDEFLQENSQFSQAIKHQTNLEPAIELLVTFVDQRLMTIPLATRLCAIASECARDRFGEEAHLVKRTLSALLILRVLNPIIFSILNSGIGSQIAKLVQISANSAASQSANDSLTPSALTIRRIFERMIILVDQHKFEFEEKPLPEGELHTEWLACLSLIIGHSHTLRSSVSVTSLSSLTSSTTLEEVHRNVPTTVLELIRLHQ
uniref:SH3 domain-containing protein n=1 Tax=Caenorhabditis japonica TaxID=281687 RepID=A0A8R1DMI6_CAEJA